jgi:phosphoserine phosphatase
VTVPAAVHAFTAVVLGDLLPNAAIDAIVDALTAAGAIVGARHERSAAAPRVIAVELTVADPIADAATVGTAGDRALDDRTLARHLRTAAATAAPTGVDLAVVPAAVAAAGPRLLVADMDSTLIQCECIDELGRAHGVGDEIADITRRAMLGELDFEASLQARVARLAGLDARALDDLAARLPFTPGAALLVRAIHQAGGHVAVVSGGFTFATDAVAAHLGLDHAHANILEIVDGRLTGGLVGPVVGPARKATLVDELAARHGLPPARVVAIGDGANDLPMLARAGLGVAFHAKPKVAAAADTALTRGGLERVLYLLGHARAELDAWSGANA